MQRDTRFFSGKATSSHGYTHDAAMDGYGTYGTPVEPGFNSTIGGAKHGYPGPLNGVEFQPSETCPRNFIIFDQTDEKSRIMFNPALARKFSYPGGDVGTTHTLGSGRNLKNENQDKYSSLKEDSEDINALLSLEDEEEYEEDDVISTGRTPLNYGASSPDSICSIDASRSSKMRFSSGQVTASGSTSGKKEKMRKMVKALRGIVPGGNQMDTPAVLDEAVKYLKSLKMEVKKLGVQDFKD